MGYAINTNYFHLTNSKPTINNLMLIRFSIWTTSADFIDASKSIDATLADMILWDCIEEGYLTKSLFLTEKFS